MEGSRVSFAYTYHFGTHDSPENRFADGQLAVQVGLANPTSTYISDAGAMLSPNWAGRMPVACAHWRRVTWSSRSRADPQTFWY